MKKNGVLIVLFVLPIVVYLFFASGVTNFGKLPILTENIPDLPNTQEGITLEGHITVLGFLGSDLELKKGNAFNLNQKIYKRFYEFKDFQFVMVLPEGTQGKVVELEQELAGLADTRKWHFVYATENDIQDFFEGLRTNLSLDKNTHTPYVFIVDKQRNLRGRAHDEDQGTKYGFDATSVADLNNKMVDDVKIILAEYRMALKKNNADRSAK
ncbi:MAG: hypothetical protein AAFX53_02340 [Bacteroidota bacterium]